MGVCGGVAAYKAAGLARLLTREYSVQTILTPTAREFVGAATFRALTGREVATDEFRAPVSDNGMDHISLTRGAAGMVVAPATADFMAKAAAGMADNLLLAAFLAADCPKWIAPAMNQNMWRAAATRRNADILAADGAIVLPPDSGEQACGDVGPGRMMEPEDIVMRLRRRLSSLLVGRKVVVSTGATAEKIDPMRLITNRSSGAMGFCLAQAAEQAGANVRIVAAHTSASPPSLPIRRVENGREMLAAVLEECRDADMFFSAAAVADYRPSSPTSEKIPRQKGKITLSMSPSEDILAAAVKQYPALFAVGFAAQSGDKKARIAAARAKMRRKKTAMMVENSVADAGGDSSELTILTAGGEIGLPRQPKMDAAAEVVAQAAAMMVSRETQQEAK